MRRFPGVHLHKTGDVDGGEEQVAQLLLHIGALGHGGLQLLQLLRQLVQGAGHVRPVEARLFRLFPDTR